MTFKPYEIPTHGKPPALRLLCDEAPDGRRLVHVDSPWVLAVRRPSGELVPLDRMGGRWLEPGDEVIAPPSVTEDVDSRVLFRTQLQGIREYHEAHVPTFETDDPSAERFGCFGYTPPDRWWWHRRELPHGLVLHLHQASSNARLSVSITGELGFQGSWCYPDHHDGWRAVLGWNGWGDPPDGWIRHLETARRRKDGSAATEYVLASEQGAYR